MKATVLNYIRKKGAYILFLFIFLFAVDSYSQFGTSRRVARRTARRTTRRNVGYSGAGGYYSAPPAGGNYQPYFHGTEVVYR